MTNDSERLLSATLSSFSKGRQRLFSHIGLLVAAIALLAAALVTFTDISLLSLTAESLTLQMAVYAAVTAVMFLSLEEEGERAGRGEEAYKEAVRSFRAAEGRVLPSQYAALEKFCRKYAEEELADRRAHFLLCEGISDPSAPLPARVQKRLRRLKPLSISAAALLEKEMRAAPSPLQSPDGRRKRRMAFKLFPSIACTVFGIGIAIGVRDALTPSAVAEGLLRIATLLIVALRGYLTGYLFVGESEIPFLQAKTRLLERFLCPETDASS